MCLLKIYRCIISCLSTVALSPSTLRNGHQSITQICSRFFLFWGQVPLAHACGRRCVLGWLPPREHSTVNHQQYTYFRHYSVITDVTAMLLSRQSARGDEFFVSSRSRLRRAVVQRLAVLRDVAGGRAGPAGHPRGPICHMRSLSCSMLDLTLSVSTYA